MKKSRLQENLRLFEAKELEYPYKFLRPAKKVPAPDWMFAITGESLEFVVIPLDGDIVVMARDLVTCSVLRALIDGI